MRMTTAALELDPHAAPGASASTSTSGPGLAPGSGSREVTRRGAARALTTLLSAAAVATALGGLGGCGTTKSAPTPARAEDDPVARRLREAIVKAGSGPEYTRSAEGKAPAMVAGPSMTVDYQGEAAVLLKGVAAQTGRSFKQTGPQPYLPLVVHVDVVNQPFVEFLKDLGQQFSARADLVLSDSVLEIRYRSMSAMPHPTK